MQAFDDLVPSAVGAVKDVDQGPLEGCDFHRNTLPFDTDRQEVHPASLDQGSVWPDNVT